MRDFRNSELFVSQNLISPKPLIFLPFYVTIIECVCRRRCLGGAQVQNIPVSRKKTEELRRIVVWLKTVQGLNMRK